MESKSMRPWSDMTPRERDEVVAEVVMGWQKRYSPNPTIYAWERPDGERYTRQELPEFTADHAAGRIVVGVMARRGPWDQFVLNLLSRFPGTLIRTAHPPIITVCGAYLLLLAEPDQICQAAIETIREAGR